MVERKALTGPHLCPSVPGPLSLTGPRQWPGSAPCGPGHTPGMRFLYSRSVSQAVSYLEMGKPSSYHGICIKHSSASFLGSKGWSLCTRDSEACAWALPTRADPAGFCADQPMAFRCWRDASSLFAHVAATEPSCPSLGGRRTAPCALPTPVLAPSALSGETGKSAVWMGSSLFLIVTYWDNNKELPLKISKCKKRNIQKQNCPEVS